ncbi:MAG: hypothetical protein JXR03_18095 [Cyclobacteriaceae bacterium]
MEKLILIIENDKTNGFIKSDKTKLWISNCTLIKKSDSYTIMFETKIFSSFYKKRTTFTGTINLKNGEVIGLQKIITFDLEGQPQTMYEYDTHKFYLEIHDYDHKKEKFHKY